MSVRTKDQKKPQVAMPASKLVGRTVLVTRSAEGNSVEKEKLKRLGANVVEFAAIKITPPSSWAPFDRAIAMLEKFDWVIFTSANGVHAFFERCTLKVEASLVLEALKNGKSPSFKPKFACVGPSTKSALEEYGFKSSFEPREFLTSALAIELTKFEDMRNQNVLFARAQEASREIRGILEAAGAEVIDAPVYRTESQPLVAQGKMDDVTDVTLTSPSIVDALVSSLPAAEINTKGILVHCIGPVTAERARQKGLRVQSIAQNHTIDGLIDSMVERVVISKTREN